MKDLSVKEKANQDLLTLVVNKAMVDSDKVFSNLNTHWGYFETNIIEEGNQEWYFSEGWQIAEKEAENEFKKGQFKTFNNMKDLIKDLKK